MMSDSFAPVFCPVKQLDFAPMLASTGASVALNSAGALPSRVGLTCRNICRWPPLTPWRYS
eukprot:2420424-Pyramimonas_sp.AAC.1